MSGSWTSLDPLRRGGVRSSEPPAVHMFQQGARVSHSTRGGELSYPHRAGRVARGTESPEDLDLERAPEPGAGGTGL